METSDVKKARLSDGDDNVATITSDDIESIPVEDVDMDDSLDIAVEHDDVSAEPILSEDVQGSSKTQKKGKSTKGADIHFKENPYTFISPQDPILQTCM